MTHALIVAHPDADSVTLSRAQASVAALEAVLRALSGVGVHPRVADGAIPRPQGLAPREDV